MTIAIGSFGSGGALTRCAARTGSGAERICRRDVAVRDHSSLLRTTDAAFGIDEPLGHAADERSGAANMTPLFAVVP